MTEKEPVEVRIRRHVDATRAGWTHMLGVLAKVL